MDHNDHIALLRDGVPDEGAGRWADFGSGSGAFTLALAELLGSGGEIYSIDIDPVALREQEQALHARYPTVLTRTLVADYTRPIDLPRLDGLVIANALHYQRDRDRRHVLRLLRGYLKPGGRLIVVEYNTDRGNRWAPYPFSYDTWLRISSDTGFEDTRLLATRPSRFLGEIYSALSRAYR